MRLSAEEDKIVQNITRQFPAFVEILNRWRSDELENLPFAVNNLDVMRGRVQALTEMKRLFEPR
jgi:hypothetical protein